MGNWKTSGKMQEMREILMRRTLRSWVVGGLTILILLLALAGSYHWRGVRQRDARAVELPAALEPYPMTVISGIHLLGGLAPAAAYVVETSEGLVLVDAGLDKQAESVRQQMASLGLDWRQIRAILLTHVHGDHTGGAAYLRAATGARTYAGRGDVTILKAGKPRDAFFSTFWVPPDVDPVPVTVDVPLDDQQIVTLGDVSFQVLASPGHTPGSVCYLVQRQGRRILFSGDVIWALSPQVRPLGTYAAYLAPRYGGNALAYLTTLHRLRAMPVPDLVLPGHPRLNPVPMSPAISQERWEALLDAGIAEMERLQAHYAQDGAGFLDGVPKKLLLDLYYLGDLKDTAVYALVRSSGLFLVNAPGPGLSDFLRDRLRQVGVGPQAPTGVLLTSGDAESTNGVVELVERYGCQVVASPEAWREIKSICPSGTAFLAADDLPEKGWFDVKVIPLGGRGVGGIGYLLPWRQKAVLFSGRIPMKPGPATARTLWIDLSQLPGGSLEYQAALRRLELIKPDLWLPSLPIDGQNANLYDKDWKDLLDGNAEMLRSRGKR
jgi:glyoxylase-like metal-dependent hydrolase (beta-lactamase superfamily II)